MNIKAILCSVPVETPGAKLRRRRSEGPVGIMPKIAITSLNNWAVKNGFDECKFYDIDMLYPTDEEIRDYFLNNQADIIGLSAVVSTSYMQVRRITKIINDVNPRALIVCGGYLTAASNVLLNKTFVDVCVVGDGETAWVGLLNYIKNNLNKNDKINVDELSKIRGLSFLGKDNDLVFTGYGHIQSCQMSFPSFDYLKSGLNENEEAINNYFRPFYLSEEFVMDDRSFEKGRREMLCSLHVSKGCVAKCTFCQRGAKGYLVYNLDDLEKHLIQLKKYNVGFVNVDDENFGSNKKYTYQVAELLNKHGMLWQCTGVRCTSVNKEDLKYYKDNGCVSLKFGIESGSQTMLDIMEKRFTVNDIKKALFSCYEIDLYSPPLGFMVGMPGETLDTAKESGKLLGEIAANLRVPLKQIFGLVEIFYAIPLFGTPLYEYGRKLNLLGSSIDEEEKYLELVSNVGAYKRYYINLNGAPMSEVVFWDFLVFLEATKTFVKLMKNKSLNINMMKRLNRLNENQAKNPHTKEKDNYQTKTQIFGGGGGDENIFKKNKNFITNFVKKNIAFNEKIAKFIPRFILYPLVRYALYCEYLFQKIYLKDSNNLHMETNSKVNKDIRITKKDIDFKNTTQIDRSLRNIVKRKFGSVNNSAHERLVGGP